VDFYRLEPLCLAPGIHLLVKRKTFFGGSLDVLHSMPHSTHGSSATMSRPSSTSTGSANAFPKPAGATLLAPEHGQDQLSPSRSTFSYESSPQSAQVAFERGASIDEVRNEKRGSRQKYGTRQRAQYFEDSFAYKDDTISSARERVTRDAPIIADLRTNVIVSSLNRHMHHFSCSMY
jgi:hypothetical protein